MVSGLEKWRDKGWVEGDLKGETSLLVVPLENPSGCRKTSNYGKPKALAREEVGEAVEIKKIGASGQIRTDNHTLTRRLLYLLELRRHRERCSGSAPSCPGNFRKVLARTTSGRLRPGIIFLKTIADDISSS